MASKLYMRSIRGPSAYVAGGFTTTLDEMEYLTESSSLNFIVAPVGASTSIIANAQSYSGNIVTIVLRDTRSGGLEPTSGDFSGIGFSMVYQGI